MSLVIFQTSDVHIGAKLKWLGSKADEQRNQILHTFSRIVQTAIDQKANLVLIVGDLFDTSYPSQTSIVFVLNEIDKLGQNSIHTIILPGNHDKLDTGSVYETSFANSKYLKVFRKKDVEVFDLFDIGVSVYGHGYQDKETFKKIKGFYSRYPGKLEKNVALIHSGVDVGRGFPAEVEVDKSDIENSGFDIVAFGDWHQALEIVNSKTKAWYSGSPEILAKDQVNSGQVLKIVIDEFSSTVEPVKVSNKIIEKVIFNVETVANIENSKFNTEKKIMNLIQQKTGRDTILFFCLEGKRELTDIYDLEKVRQIFQDQFFFLEFDDKTELKLDEKSLEKYPEELVVGRFVKMVRSKMKKEEDKEKIEILELVLEEGIKILTQN
jgi:DNA repair protein SbcD/Mre11